MCESEHDEKFWKKKSEKNYFGEEEKVATCDVKNVEVN